MYNTLTQLLDELVLKCVDVPGTREVFEYAYRFEYQGRGTIHVHVVAWVVYHNEKDSFGNEVLLSGRSRPPLNKDSPLLQFLEALFKSSVDVQCKEGMHCLLRYVTGYVSKASDALAFKHHEWKEQEVTSGSQWKQIYRLLTKRAPLEPGMVIEFMGAQLMKASFRSTTLYAQIPGSNASNDSRDCYKSYLARRDPYKLDRFIADDVGMNFIEFVRKY